MKRLLLILLLPLYGFSQNYGYFAGSRSSALAHSSVAIQDIWSSTHNQAGLAFIDNSAVAISYQNRYHLKELVLGNLCLAYKTKAGTVGLNINQFGFSLFNQTKIGINYARSFGKRLGVGLQINYEDNYVDQGTSQKPAISWELGLLTKPLKKLSIGFHLYIPAGLPSFNENNETPSPIARFGFLYKPGNRFAFSSELKKDLNFTERYSFGLEYQLLDSFFLRSGIGLQPIQNTFGLGFQLKRLSINGSFQYDYALGLSTQLSLAHQL